MAFHSSAKSERRVNSADFEVGENDQIISGHSFLELSALQELKYSREVLLFISTINLSVPFFA